MLTSDISFAYKNKDGEEVCGDTIKIKKSDKKVVLSVSDGLGSGIKASILSTLTASIATTMLFDNSPLEEVFSSILSTLPICKVRGISYANLCTLLFEAENASCTVIEYEFPVVLFFRNGVFIELEKSHRFIIGRRITESKFDVKEGDYLFIMTDGVSQAGMGTKAFPLGFGIENIKREILNLLRGGVNHNDISQYLINKVKKLDFGIRGDDALIASVYFRRFRGVNILIGPPSDPSMDKVMIDRFMGLPGKKIVCGGTTAQILERITGKKVKMDLSTLSEDSPPVGYMEGIDLVTEGIITLTQVFRFFENQDKNAGYGARAIINLLENADGINFIVGRAINPAHQNPLFSYDMSLKFRLIRDIARILERKGKIVNIEYY